VKFKRNSKDAADPAPLKNALMKLTQQRRQLLMTTEAVGVVVFLTGDLFCTFETSRLLSSFLILNERTLFLFEF